MERGFYKYTTCMSHTATKVFLYAALPQSFNPDLGNTHGQKNKIKKKYLKIKKIENVMGLDTDYATGKKNTSVTKSWV